MVTYSKGQILWVQSTRTLILNQNSNFAATSNCGSKVVSVENTRVSVVILDPYPTGYMFLAPCRNFSSKLERVSRTSALIWWLGFRNCNGFPMVSPTLGSPHYPQKQHVCWVNLHQIPTIQDGVANFDFFQNVMQSVGENAEEGVKFWRCEWRENLVKTIINHPFGNGL